MTSSATGAKSTCCAVWARHLNIVRLIGKWELPSENPGSAANMRALLRLRFAAQLHATPVQRVPSYTRRITPLRHLFSSVPARWLAPRVFSAHGRPCSNSKCGAVARHLRAPFAVPRHQSPNICCLRSMPALRAAAAAAAAAVAARRYLRHERNPRSRAVATVDGKNNASTKHLTGGFGSGRRAPGLRCCLAPCLSYWPTPCSRESAQRRCTGGQPSVPMHIFGGPHRRLVRRQHGQRWRRGCNGSPRCYLAEHPRAARRLCALRGTSSSQHVGPAHY